MLFLVPLVHARSRLESPLSTEYDLPAEVLAR
jgi:hypothetical protein